jgi:hypothetical protein
VVGAKRCLGLGRLVLVVGLTSCWYDSRWGQEKKLQQQRAAQTEKRLAAEPGEREGARAVRGKPFRVRFLVTRGFSSQVIDVPKHVRELLDDASDVVAPALGSRFEVESVRAWELDRDDDLDKVLLEEAKADPASEVDWVVGLVGALPMATASFHEIGRSRVPGKHMVLRAPSSAQRHDAVDRSFDELSGDERQRVQKNVRRHRATVVFLHELGHSLGCLHEKSATSIMHPRYDTKATTFVPQAVGVMMIALEGRKAKTPADEAKLLRDLATVYKKAAGVDGTGGLYVEEDRTKFIALFEETATRLEAPANANGNANANAPPPPAPSGPAIPDTPSLTVEHRALFVRAYETVANKGDYVGAWEIAKPLFAAYPREMAVQDFRCKLASSTMSFPAARRECDALMKISTDTGK